MKTVVDTLASKREELAARLAAARLKAPEEVIAAELAKVEEQLSQAQAEEQRQRLAEKQAELDQLGAEFKREAVAVVADLEALHAKIMPLIERYNRAFAAVTTAATLGERLRIGKVEDYAGIFTRLERPLTDYLRAAEFTNRDLVKKSY